jgi:hypothetical protein
MNSVDLTPLYTTINEALAILLSGLATAVVGAFGIWLKKHLTFLSAQTDASVTNAFNTALQNGSNIALNSLDKYEGEHSTVAVQSWVAAKAAQYAVDNNRDFVKRFTGKTPDELSDTAVALIQKKALAFVPPVQVVGGSAIVNGTPITLGQPSPTNQTDAQERAETAALNNAQTRV